MGHVTWVTILFGSMPESFFTFLIATTLLGIETNYRELLLISIIQSFFCYIILNCVRIPFGIHSICIILILSIILKKMKKIRFINSCIGVIFGWMISSAIQYINMVIICLLGLDYRDLVQDEILKILYFYPSVICFAIFAIIIHKKNIIIYKNDISEKDKKSKKRYDLFIVISFVLNFTILVLFNMYLSVYKNDVWDSEKRFTVIMIIMLMISIVLMILIIARSLKQNLIKEYEKMLLDRNLEDMKKNIKTLRKQRHDYLRHMQIIYSLLNDNKYYDIKEYIESLTEHINNEGIYIETGNTFLNSVISLKQEQSRHRKIKFEVLVKSKIDNIKIPNFEFCNIISNIIDNAFDALDESEIGNKFVYMIICGDELCYILKIKNNGNEIKNIDKIFDEGFSTKKGKNRGYGLCIVKQTLEKYRASIFIESKEDITEFNIVVPKY